jgi:carbamoyltransferase
MREKVWALDRLADTLGVARARVTFVTHHEAHAASAFFVSPFESAAVLTVDGVGESQTTSIHRAHGDGLEELESLHYPHSLGLFYAAFTALLGFRVNEGELTLMGLAACGRPTQVDAVREVVRLAADGSFELDLAAFGHHAHPERPYARSLVARFGEPRDARRRWDLDDPADRRWADVAASVQLVLEDALLGLCRRARERSGAPDLCLAGGVALNSVAVARIARTAGFERVFVQPAAGDAGGALGAAILGALALGDPRPPAIESALLGVPANPARALDVANALGLDARRITDPAGRMADALVAGQRVGLVHGRCEWGPRALGGRSLLASPRDAATRDQLNRMKRREPFRPFAPAVLEERASEHFGPLSPTVGRFMTSTTEVRPESRSALAAVTHVDGSARVQTVTASSSPLLHAILEEMDTRTGVPVVLNTSLNGRGQPICGDEVDALGCMSELGLSALLVEDVWIARR